MTVKHVEEKPEQAGESTLKAGNEVTIEIDEREGRQFIVIKERLPDGPALPVEKSVEIPAALLPELKRAVAALEVTRPGDAQDCEPPRKDKPGGFAHASEEEFARILDFYHIAWQYEPRAFAIEWDAEGEPVKSFTPDFYLPEHDLYIELTTLKQQLVTKKNRKVRRLRELYPDVNIKILYASDYRKLVEKFAASGTWQEQEASGKNDDRQVDRFDG